MSSEAVFVDTSALIALIIEQDQFHFEAARYLENRPILITSSWVVEEFLAHLHTRHGKPSALKGVSFLEKLPKLKIAFLDEKILANSFSLFKKYASKRVSMVDVSNVCFMKDLGLEKIFCFDGRFSSVFELEVEPNKKLS